MDREGFLALSQDGLKEWLLTTAKGNFSVDDIAINKLLEARLDGRQMLLELNDEEIKEVRYTEIS